MQLRFLPAIVLLISATAGAQSAKRPKIGIALEGGGAFGLAHVGVLEFLEQQHIPIDFVAGTSMGGLVGGLYAMGKSPAEIRKLIKEVDWDAVLGGSVPYPDLSFRRKEDGRAYPNQLDFGLRHGIRFGNGLNSGQQVAFILDDATLPYYKLDSFDQLPIPFRCVATNLNTGDVRVFKDGSLSDALRATISIPAVFSPVKTKGGVFADGGLLNNLPVDIVRAMGADIVIAVYLKGKPYDSKTSLPIPSLLDRSISIMIVTKKQRNMEAADDLGKTRLVVNAQEKDHAPPFLDLGFKVDGSGYNITRIGFAGRVTILDPGGYRSELRTDATVAYSHGLKTEYYGPISGSSKLFLAPRFFVDSTAIGLCRRRSRLAEYRFIQTGAALDVVYAICPDGEFRRGCESGYIHAGSRTCGSFLPEVTGRTGYTILRNSYDGVNAQVIPRSGHLIRTSLKIVDRFRAFQSVS